MKIDSVITMEVKTREEELEEILAPDSELNASVYNAVIKIKNEKNLAYTNAAPAMGQPGNPYVNPVTGQPYDAGVVKPVTGQTYNQTPNTNYGQAPNQAYNQTPDGTSSVPYTPGQNTDNTPYS